MIANASHDDATCKKQGEKHASQLQNQKRETCILDADHFHTIGNIYTKLGECWGGYISVDFPCFPHMINHFWELNWFIWHPNSHTMNNIDNHGKEVMSVSQHNRPVNIMPLKGGHRSPCSSRNTTKLGYIIDNYNKVALDQYQHSSLSITKQQPVMKVLNTWASSHPTMH